MEIRQLNTFCLAAKTLNFTRTAETLNYAQSSVTAQIQSLEAELGVRLFERLGKTLRLTREGERFFEYARQITRLVEEARSALETSQDVRGRLTIGSVESLCTYRLPPLLQVFRERYPNVDIILQPDMCRNLRRGLVEGRFDAAFLLDKPVQTPGIVAESLVEEELLVLAHADSPHALKSRISPKDLGEDQVLLVTEAGCSYRALFERSLDRAGVRPQTELEFGSVEALKQCAILGMGVTVLPKMAVNVELRSGRLVPLRWSEPLGPLVTQIALHKDKWITPTLEALMATAREVFASIAGGEARHLGNAQATIDRKNLPGDPRCSRA